MNGPDGPTIKVSTCCAEPTTSDPSTEPPTTTTTTTTTTTDPIGDAVIVTGGSGVHDGHRHAEVILGDGSTCLLPSLPQGQGAYGHSQSGLMYCGGDNTEDSCLTFSE